MRWDGLISLVIRENLRKYDQSRSMVSPSLSPIPSLLRGPKRICMHTFLYYALQQVMSGMPNTWQETLCPYEWNVGKHRWTLWRISDLPNDCKCNKQCIKSSKTDEHNGVICRWLNKVQAMSYMTNICDPVVDWLSTISCNIQTL